MPSAHRRVIKSYLTPEEHQELVQSAANAGLSVSAFVKRLCLAQVVHSRVDHQAVLALAKANADMGRLGGLFKMVFAEGRAGLHADELRAVLRSIETTKEQLARDYEAVARGLSRNGRR
jgi:phage shock protein A